MAGEGAGDDASATGHAFDLTMDGIHDMGAMQGFGPMVRDEAVFNSPVEELEKLLNER